jgi:hypothetical protein
MAHHSINRKILPAGLLWILLVAPLLLQAQPAERTYCDYKYPEYGFEMRYFCDAKQIKKNESSIAFTYEHLDRSNPNIIYEQSVVFLEKYKTRYSLTVQEIENRAKATLEKRLSEIRSQLGVTTSKTVTGEGYDPKLRYTTEGISYTHYTYMKTSEGTDLALEFVNTFYFDNGFVAATSFFECLKKLSSYEAEQYRSNKPPAFATFTTRPIRIEYKTSGRYQVSSSAVGLSFELAQHNLKARESAAEKMVFIDYVGVPKDNRADYGAENPITLKLVKKMGVNEKFATVAAPYLKESYNNQLNGYDAKKYPAFKNMVVFKKRWEFRPGMFGDLPEPYRYLFEFNGFVYDLSGEITQRSIMDSILKTLRVYKGVLNSDAKILTGGTKTDGTFNRDLLLGMDEWLKDRFEAYKGTKKETKILREALGTQRFETTLKLGKYPTEIVEEGFIPDNRRDWVGTLGTFDSKEEALKLFNEWQKIFLTFKHEQFQLKEVRKTEDEVVWSPQASQKGLPEQFSTMEVRLRVKQQFLIENGTMVVRYLVLLSVGSKL